MLDRDENFIMPWLLLLLLLLLLLEPLEGCLLPVSSVITRNGKWIIEGLATLVQHATCT